MNKKREIETRFSDEGAKRLIDGILKQTIRDWLTYVKIVNNNKSRLYQKAMYELKQIIDFVQSDWFTYLTNASCPQNDCINGLVSKITNEKAREDIINYSLTNKSKWEKSNKQMLKEFEIK